MPGIAQTPDTPYYAVIFTSTRTQTDDGYADMAARMDELAAMQPGYLGIESARDGLGVTISYWASLDAIDAWHQNTEHELAQRKGYQTWYQSFKVRVCKVERDYGFGRKR